MADVDPVLLVLSLAGIPVVIWFHVHCARPALALAGARPGAFLVTELASLCVLLGSVIFLVASVAPIPLLPIQAARLLVLAVVVPAVAFLRPGVLVRLFGGADPTVPPRFVLGWYRRRMGQDGHSTNVVGFATGLSMALGDLGPPADQAVVEVWKGRAQHLLAAARTGQTTLRRELDRFGDQLASVPPVDTIGRLFG